MHDVDKKKMPNLYLSRKQHSEAPSVTTKRYYFIYYLLIYMYINIIYCYCIAEFHYSYEDDADVNSMPIITLEVLSDSSRNGYNDFDHQQNAIDGIQDTGVHFLTEKPSTDDVSECKDQKETPKAKNEFLEYMTRNDGSVVCKLCGEILQSRTHWYRHKYKLHVIHPLNPSPLFQCEQCLVYFKSRKGKH